MKQIPYGTDGRIQYAMLHVHHERQIVFSPVADYRKRALHHITFLQILSMEAIKNFCIGAGKLVCYAFHQQMVRYYRSFYIAFRCRKDVKRAFVRCSLRQGNLYFRAGEFQRTILIIEVSS